MGWTLSFPVPGADDVAISDADLTAGEWASIYELVAKSVLHDERAIHPLHCPLCRNAIAVTALIVRAGVDSAIASEVVAAAPRLELLAAVTVTDD